MKKKIYQTFVDDWSDKVRKKIKQFWQFFHKKTKSQVLVFNWWYFRIEWSKADLDFFIQSISPTDSKKKKYYVSNLIIYRFNKYYLS